MKVYDRKDNCKTKLNKNFILNTDFNVQNLAPENSGARNLKAMQAGKNKENIMLTVDCFKSMCMLANSEIGKQVKNYYLDLEKIFKEYILRDIQSMQKTIETVVNENLKIKSTYSHLAELNDKLRMKRNYHKFKKGNCLYIITDRWREKDYLKIGYTDNINTRLQTYRTSMPDVKIEFLLYLTENKVLEKCLKLRFWRRLILLKDFYLQCKIETKMTTAHLKNDQLPNNRLEVFKSNTTKNVFKSDLVKISDNLFTFNLHLKNGSKIIVPMREDGYINATMLCKAGGKLFGHYKSNKQTQEYLQALESVIGIPITELIHTTQGGIPEYQGTYVHRKVGLHLAQWIDPYFAIQVTTCFEELLLFGKVELGQEKSNKELEEKFNEKIKSMQKTIETVVNENLKIKSTYSHLAELNDKLRMKRNYHKFKKGNCLYIITDRWREKDYLKIGYTDNINTRLQTYRTSMPDVKIEFLLYLTENKVLEKCLKLRFASKLVQKNHEYVIDATLEQLVKSINSLTKYLSIEATEETKLSLYNEPYKIYNLVFLDQNGNVEDNTDPIVLASPAKPHTPMGLDFDSSDDENDNEPESNTETKPKSESEHDSDSEVYKCDICGTEYKTKSRLLNHMIKFHNIQKDVKDDGKTCPICKKVFRDRGKRNRHVRSVHEKSSIVKCIECDTNYSSNDALMNHIRNVHKKITQSKCDQCGTICSTVGNLKKHIAQVHDKTTSVSCNICDKKFFSQCNLTQHIIKVHKRKEKCNCQLCGKEFLSLLGLKYHMRNVHKI
jgi:phage anti-repressor protein